VEGEYSYPHEMERGKSESSGSVLLSKGSAVEKDPLATKGGRKRQISLRNIKMKTEGREEGGMGKVSQGRLTVKSLGSG